MNNPRVQGFEERRGAGHRVADGYPESRDMDIWNVIECYKGPEVHQLLRLPCPVFRELSSIVRSRVRVALHSAARDAATIVNHAFMADLRLGKGEMQNEEKNHCHKVMMIT